MTLNDDDLPEPSEDDPMDESMVERVARALYDALRGDGLVWVHPEDSEEFGATERITVDGHVDCRSLARAAIEALRWPNAECPVPFTCPVEPDGSVNLGKAVNAYLDAVLASEADDEEA